MKFLRYVAFLAAINVGGRRLTMADLRVRFEQMGFARVETFIASGNVIFEAEGADTAGLEAQIEAQLQQALGYPVATFVRTPREIADVAGYHPFGAVEGETLNVLFLKAAPPETAKAGILALGSEVDAFAFHGRELYWRCQVKMSESPLFSGSQLTRALRLLGAGTMRNATTVRKLAAKYPAGAMLP